MRRRLLNVLTVLSLLALLLVGMGRVWISGIRDGGPRPEGATGNPLLQFGYHEVLFLRTFQAPYSVVCLALLVSPVVWLLFRWEQWLRDGERPADYICPSCGYDLRATPDKCPECGATPAETTD